MGTFLQYFGRGRDRPRISGNGLKAVIQATLLFGSENWVMNPRIGRNLGRFHHRMDCRLTRMQINQDTVGQC